MYLAKKQDEMASYFISETCQLIPKSCSPSSDNMHDLVIPDQSPKLYAIVCGSGAEFYIRPLNTCIGDIDILMCRADRLAFSGDFPVLPSDISGLADAIQCYEIEPCHVIPVFVRLRDFGEMKYNWKYKKYKLNRNIDPDTYIKRDITQNLNSYVDQWYGNERTLPKVFCGPTIKSPSETSDSVYTIGIDVVHSIYCPQWPRDAKTWPLRSRNNGWPTSHKISEVVRNGCHVVYVQHRDCRDDTYQWRLSFSVAEVILLQSWTKPQQIVYHLLRFFAKRELIKKDCPKEDEVLCTYHLKTLMLWTCEDKPPEWWNSESIITMCSELLTRLSGWLKKKRCSNYFIPEANLFNHKSSSDILEKTVRQLNKFSNSKILCRWFVEHYILSFIRSNFEPVGEIKNLAYYMSALFEVWKMNHLKSLELLLYKTFVHSHSCRSIMKQGLNSGVSRCFKTACTARSLELKTIRNLKCLPTIQKVSCFTHHDNLIFILHVAYSLDCGEISWDSSIFVEFVNAISLQPKITWSQYHNFPKMVTTQSSRFQLIPALILMKNLTGSNSRSGFQLLFPIAKEFLIKALKLSSTTRVSHGIVLAALAYLAALHFASSEYEEATRLCSSVLMEMASKEDREPLNAGCLLFIDDVARIVGLSVLLRNVIGNNLHYINRRLYLDLRLSPKVFVQYLSVTSAKRMCKQSNLYNDLRDSVFQMNVNLKALTKATCIFSIKSGSLCIAAKQIVNGRPASITETEASRMNPSIVKERVLEALMESAVENITSFNDVIRNDFDLICNTADCYRALYLYKCRKCDELLHLCERILRGPDMQNDSKEFSYANIFVLPPLDFFFDGDVQSLLGFHTLFYSLSPLNGDLWKLEFTAESTFEHWFARVVFRDKNQIVEVLQVIYSIKCQYFLGRHFLAKYLKLRCYIDYDLSYSEALTDFAVHRTILPFEHIIRRFLLRKLRIRNK